MSLSAPTAPNTLVAPSPGRAPIMRRSFAATAVAAALAAAPFASALDHAGSAAGTWAAADSPHRIVGDVNVPADMELRIEAGALVTATAGARLVVDGRLVASGTSSAPVTFLPDDRHQAWGGIVLGGPDLHELDSVDIVGAVRGIDTELGARLVLRSSRVASCESEGAWLGQDVSAVLVDSVFESNGGAGVYVRDASPRIERCRFGANEVPIVISGGSFPEFADLSAGWNALHDGIAVDVATPPHVPGTWTDGGLPYVVEDDATFVVGPPVTLTLEPGVTLKMGSSSAIRVDGTLRGRGTLEAPCLVTSLADDLVDGDTNRDGTTTRGGKGSWSGIDVELLGTLDLASCELRQATDAVRVFAGGSAVIVGSEIHQNLFRGVAYGAGADGRVELSSIHDNDVGVQVTDASSVDLGRPSGPSGEDLLGGRNTFGCNGFLDVENRDATVLPAQRNWWSTFFFDGSSLSGPIDASEPLGDESSASSSARVLRVERFDASSLLLSWAETSTCTTHRVLSSDDPRGPFGVAGEAGTNEAWLEPIAGPRVVHYRIDVANHGGSGGEALP